MVYHEMNNCLDKKGPKGTKTVNTTAVEKVFILFISYKNSLALSH